MLRTASYECYHKDRQGSMGYALFVINADEYNGFNTEHLPRFCGIANAVARANDLIHLIE